MGSAFSIASSIFSLVLYPFSTCAQGCIEFYAWAVRLITTFVLFFVLAPYRLLTSSSRRSQIQSKIEYLQHQVNELSAANQDLKSKLNASEADRWRSREKVQRAIFQRTQLKEKLIAANARNEELEVKVKDTEKQLAMARETGAKAEAEALAVAKYFNRIEKSDNFGTENFSYSQAALSEIESVPRGEATKQRRGSRLDPNLDFSNARTSADTRVKPAPDRHLARDLPWVLASENKGEAKFTRVDNAGISTVYEPELGNGARRGSKALKKQSLWFWTMILTSAFFGFGLLKDFSAHTLRLFVLFFAFVLVFDFFLLSRKGQDWENCKAATAYWFERINLSCTTALIVFSYFSTPPGIPPHSTGAHGCSTRQ